MNKQWLQEQDADFHKRQYRAFCAQLVFSQHNRLGYDALITRRMDALFALGNITKTEADNLMVEVRVELAETEVALHKALELETAEIQKTAAL